MNAVHSNVKRKRTTFMSRCARAVPPVASTLHTVIAASRPEDVRRGSGVVRGAGTKVRALPPHHPIRSFGTAHVRRSRRSQTSRGRWQEGCGLVLHPRAVTRRVAAWVPVTSTRDDGERVGRLVLHHPWSRPFPLVVPVPVTGTHAATPRDASDGEGSTHLPPPPQRRSRHPPEGQQTDERPRTSANVRA